jgi:hypothetical protein
VILRHYLHRKCPISYAFGAFAGPFLVGVLTVGKSPSWSQQYGLVGEKYEERKDDPSARARDVYELNRLWMSDSYLLPDHCESRFIGWCLRELRKIHPNIILVSYADTSQGHLGVVYKATNWIYTGTNIRFKDIHPKGYGDYRSVPKSVRGEKIGNRRHWSFDPNIRRVERSTKHRYVWFSNAKDRSLLAWEVLPYPQKERAEEPEPEKFTQAWFAWNGRRGGLLAASHMTRAQKKERAAKARKAKAALRAQESPPTRLALKGDQGAPPQPQGVLTRFVINPLYVLNHPAIRARGEPFPDVAIDDELHPSGKIHPFPKFELVLW